MDAATRHRLIDRYKGGYGEVVAALEGITEQELDRAPDPGEWTPRQIVHHLADSEMTAAIRFRRLLAEESPEIVGYDEMEFARRLFYDRPIEASLAVLEAARESSAQILDRLGEAEWERAGTHSERGYYSVETWLEIVSPHAHDHAEQIRRARASAPRG